MRTPPIRKQKLPDLKTVKRALYATWALHVKQYDYWRCSLCDDTKAPVMSHHWYCCDKQAHAARYVVDNGITLCFACHLRKVHLRADFVMINKLHQYMKEHRGFDPWFTETRMQVKLTTAELRRLWNEMREDVTDLDALPAVQKVAVKGGKLFIHFPKEEHPLFVPHNVVSRMGVLYEVAVVTTMENKTYRYTLKELIKEEEE